MNTAIIIKPKNQSELRFLKEFLRKSNIQSKVLSEEEIEDIGLGIILRKVDRTKKVDRSEIMKKLGE